MWGVRGSTVPLEAKQLGIKDLVTLLESAIAAIKSSEAKGGQDPSAGPERLDVARVCVGGISGEALWRVDGGGGGRENVAESPKGGAPELRPKSVSQGSDSDEHWCCGHRSMPKCGSGASAAPMFAHVRALRGLGAHVSTRCGTRRPFGTRVVPVVTLVSFHGPHQQATQTGEVGAGGRL